LTQSDAHEQHTEHKPNQKDDGKPYECDDRDDLAKKSAGIEI
jgi:hypothetical protein